MRKLVKVELSCYLDINVHLKIVKLKKRNGDWKRLKRSKTVLGGFVFLVTRLDSVVQALLSQTKRQVIERLPKFYLK